MIIRMLIALQSRLPLCLAIADRAEQWLVYLLRTSAAAGWRHAAVQGNETDSQTKDYWKSQLLNSAQLEILKERRNITIIMHLFWRPSTTIVQCCIFCLFMLRDDLLGETRQSAHKHIQVVFWFDAPLSALISIAIINIIRGRRNFPVNRFSSQECKQADGKAKQTVRFKLFGFVAILRLMGAN